VETQWDEGIAGGSGYNPVLPRRMGWDKLGSNKDRWPKGK